MSRVCPFSSKTNPHLQTPGLRQGRTILANNTHNFAWKVHLTKSVEECESVWLGKKNFAYLSLYFMRNGPRP